MPTCESDVLRGVAAVAALTDEQRAAVLSTGEFMTLRAGMPVVQATDRAGALAVILSGRVRLIDDRDRHAPLPLDVLSEGGVVGETSLFSSAPPDFSAYALNDAVVFRTRREDLEPLFERRPDIAHALQSFRPQPPNGASAPTPAATEGSHVDASRSAGSTGEQAASPAADPGVLQWQEPALDPPQAFGSWRRPFPAIRQQSVMDCGAACLATVCRYYGKHVSLNHVRELSRVGQRGASMLHLLRAAESLGFEAIPMLGTLEHLTRNHLPAIVNWRGYHWLVVYRVTTDKVTVADPAQGLMTLTREAFLEGWTRYTLYLRATERFRDVTETKPTLRQFVGYIRPFKRLLYEIAAASLALQLLNLLSPLFTKFVIDDIIVRGDDRWLWPCLLVIAAAILLNLALSVARQRLLLFVTARVNLRLVGDFYVHLLSLSLRFFEARKVGDVTSRFQENEKITHFFTHTGTEILIDLVTAVVYVGLMLYFNLSLTIVALLFLTLHIVNIRVITPALRQGYREAFQREMEATSYLLEALSGRRAIKVLGIEHYVRWTCEHLFARHANAYFATIRSTVASSLAGQLVENASSVAILFYGASLVLSERLTVGALIAFTVLAKNLAAPVQGVIGNWNQVQDAVNAVERLNDVLEVKPEMSDGPAAERIELPALRGHVRLDQVTFRYEADGKNVLQSVSLEVLPGQRVGLVGRSGSGKSTLIKLLLGFYAPSSGAIEIDGFPISGVSLPSLRKQIGIVPQDVFLFHGTVRENLSQTNPSASLAQVVEAARQAGAHEFIAALPNGYETMLDPSGSNVSGGQRQRLAIARALLQNPRLIILDEATSALDNEAERYFLHNLDELFHDRTVFMIAHRLATVRHADLIVVLDRGTIVEQGTHDELMARRGLYYFLSTQQLNL